MKLTKINEPATEATEDEEKSELNDLVHAFTARKWQNWKLKTGIAGNRDFV